MISHRRALLNLISAAKAQEITIAVILCKYSHGDRGVSHVRLASRKFSQVGPLLDFQGGRRCRCEAPSPRGMREFFCWEYPVSYCLSRGWAMECVRAR